VYRIGVGAAPQPLIAVAGRSINPAAMTYAPDGSLYIADVQNNVIRRLSPDGSLTIAAGGGAETGDGLGLSLKLASPAGIAVDSGGVVWFSEAGSGRIRKLTPNGRVETVAGTELIEPRGIRFDRSGNLWIADATGNRVYVMTAKGSCTPVAGSGDRGFGGDGDLALGAMLNNPVDVLPEGDGSVVIVDSGNNRLRTIRPVPTEAPPPQPPVPDSVHTLTLLHAATLKDDAVAPAQLAYISGDSLTGVVEVTINGARADVLDNTTGRLMVQIPGSIAPGNAEVVVTKGGATFARGPAKIVGAAPGVFTTQGGSGQALVLNADGLRNDWAHPAERSSVVSFFLTGQGTGNAAVTAEIGQYAADVVWSGPAPGLTGLYQVNVQTPGGFAPSGVVGVKLMFDGVPTQTGVTMVSR